ncbi:MAG TPA: YdcF family protein [Patescibacteria group bacterium]
MTNKLNNHYDVALVLGSGIKPDGAIPESAKIRTQKAADLLTDGAVGHIIFSGKWTYGLAYTPPLTEAEAMAQYGKSLGLEASQYIIEKESVTTVSNFCNIKRLMKEHSLTCKKFLVQPTSVIMS